MQAELLFLPELEPFRRHAITRPERRTGHGGDAEFGGEGRDVLFQREAALERARLLRRPGADLRIARPAREVGVRFVVGYLLGSLPFGYLVAKAKGVNIFEVGSKNPGATNVRRVLGSGPGNLVFLLDALKGAVVVAWPLYDVWDYSLDRFERLPSGKIVGAIPPPEMIQHANAIAVVSLAAALLGHSFSCFTRR